VWSNVSDFATDYVIITPAEYRIVYLHDQIVGEVAAQSRRYVSCMIHVLRTGLQKTDQFLFQMYFEGERGSKSAIFGSLAV
jgi:hypothetical protein